MKTRITQKHILVVVSLAIALTLIGVKVKGQQSAAVAVAVQSAKVVPLSPSDAVEAKRLYSEMNAATARWTKFRERIESTYQTQKRFAFPQAFEFDETFRFIVPKMFSTSGLLTSNDSGIMTAPPCMTMPPTSATICSGNFCNGSSITATGTMLKYAHAQQDKPAVVIPAPALYRLNSDASKVFAQIDAAEEKLRQQYAQLENQRTMLLVGAGVPEDSRTCLTEAGGAVVCAKPLPSPSPK